MAGISTSVEVVDRVSGSLNRITAALYSTTSAFGAVDRASDVAFNSEGVHAMTQEMYGYEQRIRQLEADLVDANRRLEDMDEKTKKASSSANMLRTAFGLVGAALGTMSVGKILQTSDELVQTTSRLNMMNDGLQTTDELVNMVYQSAQNARGSFSGMADVVARFGNNAKDAFSSNAEVVAFAELVQKQMTIAGASASEASNAMLQLSQGLGSGSLRGDELNSIFEQAPNLIQNIADYLDVPIGKIREMASEGELTADIVKASIFAASDEINANFEQMPMTWGQVWQSMQNTALMNFKPVLNQINKLANSGTFQNLISGVTSAMASVANVVLGIFNVVAAVGGFIADNWSIISPIIYGIIAALAVYYGWMLLVKAATAIATAVQKVYNAVLNASPAMKIVLILIAFVSILMMACNWIAKMTGAANTGFGVIAGGINVVLQFFKNLGLGVANIALGIWNVLGACASNVGTAFHNTIANVQGWFWGLLATVMEVVEGVARTLNKLPFVEIDYKGIADKADEYAAKSAEAYGSKEDYESLGDAWNKGLNTFDVFQDGWVGNAFDAGASWGDGVMDGLSGFLSMDEEDVLGGTDSKETMLLDEISTNTSELADGVNISNENLKWLRDVAEKDTINRFTTAEIKVDMKNNNNISSGMDLDGVVEHLVVGVREAMTVAAEGVYA